jgi:hypothetical protein
MHSVERDNSLFSITKENRPTTLDTVEMLEFRSDIISPKSAKPHQKKPVDLATRIDQIAIFQERILKSDREYTKIPIYNSRASFFFMNKMAVEEDGCYTICKTSCDVCFKNYKSREYPFFVMPQYTHWTRVGDLGVIINLASEDHKAAYSICADLGPDQTIIENNSTVFKGKIGEGSIALGKYLKIKDSEIGDGSGAFQPSHILYIVFPNSGVLVENGTIKEINEKAHLLFQMWGGWDYAKVVVQQKYNINLI